MRFLEASSRDPQTGRRREAKVREPSSRRRGESRRETILTDRVTRKDENDSSRSDRLVAEDIGDGEGSSDEGDEHRGGDSERDPGKQGSSSVQFRASEEMREEKR